MTARARRQAYARVSGQDVTLGAVVAGLVLLCGMVVASVGAFSLATPARAVFRGALQLAVVALVLRVALEHPALVVLVIAVMLAAVGLTAGRRLGGGHRIVDVVTCAAVGAGIPLGAYVGSGAVGRSSLLAVAFAGILLGGTMTACTLSGRRLQAVVSDRWDEVEAALALGWTERRTMGLFTGEVVREALLPGIDQTRATGLVTLPGAFVGALAGGASPADAAKFQIAVLAGIMCAQAVAAVLLVRRLAVPVLRQGPLDRRSAV
ncbi:MAG: transporter permease [Frankiales bacterium]|nr:transporter permease [Frankiales bacterium]